MRKIALIACAAMAIQASAQLLPNFGGERAGLSALAFLKNDLSPRSMALGGASVAMNGDAYSLWSNPAAATQLQNMSFSASNLMIGAGVNQSWASGIFPMKNKVSSLGFFVNALNSGEIEERTEFQPTGTGRTLYVTNIATGISYSRKLSSLFSLGVTLKYIYENIAGFTNHAGAVDVSFLYTTDYKDLQFAVMLQNFGNNSSVNGDEVAVSFNRTTGLNLDANTLPTTFSLGLSAVPWKAGDHSIRTAFQLNHPTDNAENFRFGGEYSFKQIIDFRLGYKISVLGQNYPTFGFGVRARLGGHPLYIDYATNPTNFLGWQHLFGLRFELNRNLQ